MASPVGRLLIPAPEVAGNSNSGTAVAFLTRCPAPQRDAPIDTATAVPEVAEVTMLKGHAARVAPLRVVPAAARAIQGMFWAATLATAAPLASMVPVMEPNGAVKLNSEPMTDKPAFGVTGAPVPLRICEALPPLRVKLSNVGVWASEAPASVENKAVVVSRRFSITKIPRYDP